MKDLDDHSILWPAVQSLCSACDLLKSRIVREALQKDKKARDSIISECEAMVDEVKRVNKALANIEFYIEQGQLQFQQHDSQVECS